MEEFWSIIPSSLDVETKVEVSQARNHDVAIATMQSFYHTKAAFP